MKLISCYIENFGNMKQRNFDFGKGLTSSASITATVKPRLPHF